MSKSDNVFLPKMTHYFRMSYLIHFLFNLSDLNSYGCTKLSFTLLLEASNAKNQWRITTKSTNVLNWNVWIRPIMTKHLLCLLSMPISSPFFSYFEGESMLNVLGSLLVKLTKGRTKTHHKIIIHAIFLIEWLLARYFFNIMH
jgi:hypothetical protein